MKLPIAILSILLILFACSIDKKISNNSNKKDNTKNELNKNNVQIDNSTKVDKKLLAPIEAKEFVDSTRTKNLKSPDAKTPTVKMLSEWLVH